MWYTRLESSDPTPHTDIWEEEYVGLTAHWASLSFFFFFVLLLASKAKLNKIKQIGSFLGAAGMTHAWIHFCGHVGDTTCFQHFNSYRYLFWKDNGILCPMSPDCKKKTNNKMESEKKEKKKEKKFPQKIQKKNMKKKKYIKKKKNKQLQQETRKQMLFTDALHCTRYKHLYIYLHSGVSLSSAFSLANSSLSVNQPDNATTPPSWRGYLQAAKSDTAPPWLKPPRTMFFANIPFSVSSFPMIVWIFCTDYV